MGKDVAKEWAKDDALEVFMGKHTRYREAEIRLGFIKSMANKTEEEKRHLYGYYCSELTRRIEKLNKGRRSWGSYPSFD